MKMILALVVVVISLVFILQNRQSTDIHVLNATISGPLWASLVGVFVAGALTGFLLVRSRRQQ
jgi:uncharacterized integral membrane protein